MPQTIRQVATCIALTACVSLGAERAAAQASEPLFWTTAGAGTAAHPFQPTAGASYLGASVSVSYYTTPHLVTLRRAELFTLDFLGCENQDTRETSLLYGRRDRRGHMWRSVAVGLGFVQFSRTQGDTFACTTKTEWVMGVPFEVSAMWTPTRIFGLGITAFGNINHVAPFMGLFVSYSLGRVRPARSSS